MSADIPRRTLLSCTAAVVVGAAVASLAGNTLPAQAATSPMADNPVHSLVTTSGPSLNAWQMEESADNGGDIWTRPVLGTPLNGVQVRIGVVETVLAHIIQRFHYDIDSLRPGDVVGWRHPGTVRKGLAESNLASGTAIQIRPGFYPSGQRGGFFPNQLVVVRDILTDLEGVVRWSGDDTKPDEALFYIDVPPGSGHLIEVADKLRGWAATPGQGAGASNDPFEPKRRRAAERLARLQA
ncbi:hypothetical protein ACPXCE_25880 [Streptomyces sp. DT24]|uniref:hypothetical protein n=1 Tax=unclassified Streptomyces TaxID=2593676 RepID=UPI0023B8C0B0|nr:hypothetical protein [Streptomyces sp. AM 4-1-1]WEH34283.1 hypothetical protein PZB75_13480 [Streptomyces sp. AM 4-1-1]